MTHMIRFGDLHSEKLRDADDFYELLGIPTDSTRDEIDEAFRAYMATSHEEFDDLEQEALQAIGAKVVLCSPKKREIYDTVGHDTYLTLISSGQPLDDLLERVRTKVDELENPTIAVNSMGEGGDSH